MKIRNQRRHSERIELQMTPMIDIVFQLLVFFIMTFKIVAQEGDFNIKMPLAAPSEGDVDDQSVPMRLRLTAGEDGVLAGIRLNERSFNDFDGLHNRILELVGNQTGPTDLDDSPEIEIDCDYGLRYEYVIEAVTAVSGYIDSDDNVVKLIEKIKFAPPKNAPGDGTE